MTTPEVHMSSSGRSRTCRAEGCDKPVIYLLCDEHVFSAGRRQMADDFLNVPRCGHQTVVMTCSDCKGYDLDSYRTRSSADAREAR